MSNRAVIIAEQPDDVDGAVWMLGKVVADLVECRFTAADRVHDELPRIRASMLALRALVDDMTHIHEAAE